MPPKGLRSEETIIPTDNPPPSQAKPRPTPVNAKLPAQRVKTTQPPATLSTRCSDQQAQESQVQQSSTKNLRTAKRASTSAPQISEPVHLSQSLSSSPLETISIPAKRKGRPGKDENPWRKAGVGKRSQKDISADAAGKRAEANAKAEAKEKQQEEKDLRRKNGEVELGRLMDGRSRMMKEIDEADVVPSDIDSEFIPEDLFGDEDESEYEEVVVRRKKPKPSAKEKKRASIQNHRQAVDDNRHECEVPLVAANASPSRTRPKSTANSSSTKKKPLIRDAGLAEDWRKKTKLVPPGAKTPAPRPKSEKDVGAVRETDGGLNDADVRALKPTSSTGQGRQRKQLVEFVATTMEEEPNSGDSEMAAPSVQRSRGHKNAIDPDRAALLPPKKSTTRAAKTKRPEETSTAWEWVPDWFKPYYNDSFMPTLYHITSVSYAPFTYGPTADLYLDLVTRLVSHLCPDKDYEVTRKCILYRRSKSSQDTWRNHYQKTANTVVTEALTISRKKGGDAAVKAHVKRALGPCGEAFWEKPHPTTPTGPLCSPYILEVFGIQYVKATEGAIKEFYDPDDLPVGALLLSVLAVHRAFMSCESGTSEGLEPFSGEDQWIKDRTRDYLAEHPTDRHRDGSIRQLIKRPRLFHELIRKATERVSHHRRRFRAPSGKPSEAVALYIPSSPPPEEHDDENSTPASDAESGGSMESGGRMEIDEDVQMGEDLMGGADGGVREDASNVHGLDGDGDRHEGYESTDDDLYVDDPDGVYLRSDPDQGIVRDADGPLYGHLLPPEEDTVVAEESENMGTDMVRKDAERSAELEDDGAEIIGLVEDFEEGGRELPPNFFDGFDSNPGRHLRARQRNGMITPSEGSRSGSDDGEGGFSFYPRSSDPWARIIGLSPSQLSHSESERVLD
ncbi:uncharacterized protein STEHIDRAFT_134093 [Stereum hirsutum FP-91666 SS1]|uniref:uncharacterized protein n=1 Tax=Stereum hirsutum (strain FP-91666) TaxID=721885 RepID=UPI000444A687|nr:uncharacterized protein STEHIDRAFT_134093 [Stereum hirsutum FP-91666 SS1]EIM82545.1 hypothetical protein STEHIDRAFT_134093 [Stereum hirsutum FP-91666 SS1]